MGAYCSQYKAALKHVAATAFLENKWDRIFAHFCTGSVETVCTVSLVGCITDGTCRQDRY